MDSYYDNYLKLYIRGTEEKKNKHIQVTYTEVEQEYSWYKSDVIKANCKHNTDAFTNKQTRYYNNLYVHIILFLKGVFVVMPFRLNIDDFITILKLMFQASHEIKSCFRWKNYIFYKLLRP